MKKRIHMFLLSSIVLVIGCGQIMYREKINTLNTSGYRRASKTSCWPDTSFIFKGSDIRFYNGNFEDSLKSTKNELIVDGEIIDLYDYYIGISYITSIKGENKLTILSLDYNYESTPDQYLMSSDQIIFPKIKNKVVLNIDVSKFLAAEDGFISCVSSDNKMVFILNFNGDIVSTRSFDKPAIFFSDNLDKYWFDGSVFGSFKSETRIKITDEDSTLSDKAFITEIRPTLAVYDGKALHLLDVNKGKIIKSFSIEGLVQGTQAGVFSYDGGICYVTYDYFEFPSQGIYSPWDVYYVSKRKGTLLSQLQIGETPSSMAGVFAEVKEGITKATLVITQYSYDKDNLFDWSMPKPFRTFVYPIKDVPEQIEFAELIQKRDSERQIEVRLYSKDRILSFIHDLY